MDEAHETLRDPATRLILECDSAISGTHGTNVWPRYPSRNDTVYASVASYGEQDFTSPDDPRMSPLATRQGRN